MTVFLGDAEGEASAEAVDFFAVDVVDDFLAVEDVPCVVVAALVVVAVSSFLWAQETNKAIAARAVIKDKTDIFIDLRCARPEC